MKIVVENIAKVKKAEIEINGITVLAGKNDTGKSTIGKMLYSVFNSMSNIQYRIYEERKKNLTSILHGLFRNIYGSLFLKYKYDIENYVDNLLMKDVLSVNIDDSFQSLKQFITQFEQINSEADEQIIKNYSQQITETLQLNDDDILEEILNESVNAEFCGQVNNIDNNSEGSVLLQIKDRKIEVNVRDNTCFLNKDDITLGTEVIYIDDPCVLEAGYSQMLYVGLNHKSHLKRKIYAEKDDSNIIGDMILSNKFKKIMSKLDSVCEGNIVIDNRNRNLGYKRDGSGKILDLRNLSAGLKSFAIIKSLLENRTIDVNGTIILDEPEIHLHPEWQLIFAELVVLMQLSFNLHVLINTHSPYFLNAIEVYSTKYGINEYCKYYLSEADKDNMYTMVDVTENLEKIYEKLAQPLQVLENEEYADE